MERIGDLSHIRGEMNFEWRIENFLHLSESPDKCYESPVFSFCGTSWVIWFFSNGSKIYDSVGWIGLYIQPKLINAPITVGFTFHLKTADGKADKYAKYEISRSFDKANIGWGLHKFISRSHLIKREHDLLPSGILTIICTMKKSDSNGFDSSTTYVTKYKEDFREFYLKQEDCDVIIRVKGQEFPAHLAVLKARSPVLCSMFRTDMKEKATGVAVIEDCEPSSFSDFLCFLYCSEINLSVHNVFSLFTTADKYGVIDLRSQCLRYIVANLTVDTFYNTITLALLHSEQELITVCTDFFTKNIKEIIVTMDWQFFLAENPVESNELIVKALIPNKK